MTRVICIQPALPVYRIDFFERCSRSLEECLTVYYSAEDLHGLESARHAEPHWSRMLGPVRDILPGVQWQDGALSVLIRRGDVVVVAGAPRCLSNLAVLAWARMRGARTIWWGHYWSATSKSWRFVLRLALMRLSHCVLFYTDREVEECLRDMGRFAPAFLRGLNNGINAEPIVTVRRPYRAHERGQRLLFLGRMTEKAQTGLLLEALADIRHANVQLEIVGGGPEQQNLHELAVRLGIETRITWHGTITDEMAIAEVANRCALLVYPGSVGLSLIHAMAYGLPAIVHTNRWHHMPEIAAMTPDETGLTFDEGDAASLADALAHALSDPTLLERMSGRALETVQKTFNTADMARRFVGIVRELSDETA